MWLMPTVLNFCRYRRNKFGENRFINKYMLPMPFQSTHRPLKFRNPCSRRAIYERHFCGWHVSSSSLNAHSLSNGSPPSCSSVPTVFYATQWIQFKWLSFPFLSSSLPWPPRILSVKTTITNLTKWIYCLAPPQGDCQLLVNKDHGFVVFVTPSVHTTEAIQVCQVGRECAVSLSFYQ